LQLEFAAWYQIKTNDRLRFGVFGQQKIEILNLRWSRDPWSQSRRDHPVARIARWKVSRANFQNATQSQFDQAVRLRVPDVRNAIIGSEVLPDNLNRCARFDPSGRHDARLVRYR
jgi:hypothetical protein